MLNRVHENRKGPDLLKLADDLKKLPAPRL
jgi:hypothetical protein